MWQERALRVRREIADVAAAGTGVSDVHAAAIRLVGHVVPSELTCWAVLDPEALVISSMVSGQTRIPPEYEPRLAEAEYTTQEPHRFAALAARGQPIAALSDLSDAERARSARLNTVWRPLGLDRELRVVFLADGVCWGAAGMARSGRDFTSREMEFLAAVAPAIAAATRLGVRSETRSAATGRQAAIVVVGPRGELRAATPAAREWQDRIEDSTPGRFLLMMQIMVHGVRSAASGSFQARLRDGEGQWAVLQASPLVGGSDEQVAVVIEPATGGQLLGLLLTAYGLTSRERDVCREVIGGFSTADIAEHLYISPHTVQHHLKSVFAKVAVRSRGELVARLRPDPPLAGSDRRATVPPRS